MSKAHKRRESTENSEAVSDDASDVFAAVRAPLALLAAHKWKAVAAVAVAAIGLVFGMGIVDVSKLWPVTAQNATGQVDVAAATAPGEQAAAAEAPAVIVASKPEIATCFTPGQDCMSMIVAAIDGAKAEVLVQAYSLQAKPLIKALGRAHGRGVKVRVILDKADERDPNRAGSQLIAQRILPQVDTGVQSAHNKVMIIDRDSVITGSFNFTEAAQKKNAENVLLIKGHPDIVAAYAKNWERRLAESRPYFGTMAPVL